MRSGGAVKRAASWLTWAGTALACVAILDGVSAACAIRYVRQHYDPRAAETPWQRRFGARFQPSLMVFETARLALGVPSRLCCGVLDSELDSNRKKRVVYAERAATQLR